jgi:hypothetical protein
MKLKKTTLVLLLVGACLAVVIYQEVADRGCTRPPKDFSEDDLIGTWYYSEADRHDTLIIQEGGYYKQISYVERIDKIIEYESDWQSWWVEYTGNGIPYLHLEGMRTCAHTLHGDCEKAGGSGGALWDFCEEKTVYLPPGEWVLMVLGVPKRFEQPPRGIELATFQITEFPGVYELKE